MTEGELQKKIKSATVSLRVGKVTYTIKEREVLKIVEEAKANFPKADDKLVKMTKSVEKPTRQQMEAVIKHVVDLAFDRYDWFVKYFGSNDDGDSS